jgi:hypothetical protein
MDTITEKIRLALGQTLMLEPSNPYYHCFNTGGVECEVGGFLYSLVRMIKPKYILETGTHKGISASYMGLAMSDNTMPGNLDTIEYDLANYKDAKDLFSKLIINDYVISNLCLVKDFVPRKEYDLMFLDTEVNLRLHELIKFFPHLKYGGYIFIHDMPYSLCQNNVNPDHPEFKHWPIGEIPLQVTEWIKEDKLRPMFFPNPRGMMGLYKPTPDEHKWL